MHVPDGFLSTPAAAATAAAAFLGIGLAVWRAAENQAGRVAGIGLVAAFLFTAQMVNFPTPVPGVSWHVLGGGLAVVALGLAPGILAMAAVVATQALFFNDGGVAALGANLLNMAVAGPLAAWCVLAAFGGPGAAACFCAAAAGMFASAGLCGLELAASGALPLRAAPLFLGIHAVAAVFEGAVTAAVAMAMRRRGAEMAGAPLRPRGVRALAGLALAFLLCAPAAMVLWPGGEWPDGLEHVLGRFGAGSSATALQWAGKPGIEDYAVPGVPAPFGVWLAGLLGAGLAFGAAWGVGRCVRGASRRGTGTDAR